MKDHDVDSGLGKHIFNSSYNHLWIRKFKFSTRLFRWTKPGKKQWNDIVLYT